MAKPLGYRPPVPADTAAADELDDLVAALHESGLLRTLAGGARTYPTLLIALLDALDADVLRSLLELGNGLRDLDPDRAARLAEGIRAARTDAAAAADAPPEGPRALLRRLRDPDTRRGLSASLAALAAIGRALRTR